MMRREGVEKPSRTGKFYQRGNNMPEACHKIRPERQQLPTESVVMNMAEGKIFWQVTGLHLCRIPDTDNAFDKMCV